MNDNKQNPYKNWSDRKNETNRIKYQKLLIPPTPSKIRKFALKHKYGRTDIFLKFLCWSFCRQVQHFWGKTTHLCLALPTAILPRKNPTQLQGGTYFTAGQKNLLNQPFIPHEVSWKAVNQTHCWHNLGSIYQSQEPEAAANLQALQQRQGGSKLPESFGGKEEKSQSGHSSLQPGNLPKIPFRTLSWR